MAIKTFLYHAAFQALSHKSDKQPTETDAISVASIALKRILEHERFKDNFKFCRLYMNDKREIRLGHGNLDSVIEGKSVNHVMDGTRFDMLKDDENYLLNDLYSSNFVPILTEKEYKDLAHFKEVLSQAQDISSLIDFFNDNPDVFANLISLSKTNNGLLDDLNDLVSVDKDKIKRCYKINEGETNAGPVHERFWASLKKSDFSSIVENRCDTMEPQELEEKMLDPDFLKDRDFVAIIDNHKKGAGFRGVFNKSLAYDTFQKRQEIMDKLKNNAFLYEGSLLKIISENAPSERKQALYNQFVLDEKKTILMEQIDEKLKHPTLEKKIKQNDYQWAINEVLEKIYKDYPELAQQSAPEINFSTHEFTKDSVDDEEDVLEEEFLRFYDNRENDLGVKGINAKTLTTITERDTRLVCAYTSTEIIGVAHFTKSPSNESPLNIWTMGHFGVANHFKDNEQYVEQFCNTVLDFIKEKDMIVTTYYKDTHSIDEINKIVNKGINDNNVFIDLALDASQHKNNWFWSGLEHLKMESRAIEKVSNQQLLVYKKEFVEWYNDNIRPLESQKAQLTKDEKLNIECQMENKINQQLERLTEEAIDDPEYDIIQPLEGYKSPLTKMSIKPPKPK